MKQITKYINLFYLKKSDMGETIQFIGLNELEESQKETINSLVTKHLEKIKRFIYNISSVHIHIKQHKKNDHASTYSLHVKISVPTKIFEAEKSDWDLTKAGHMCFEALENEIQHYLGATNKSFMKKNSKNE
jgi:ribosome-associated translation inhibitor RaiA